MNLQRPNNSDGENGSRNKRGTVEVNNNNYNLLNIKRGNLVILLVLKTMNERKSIRVLTRITKFMSILKFIS